MANKRCCKQKQISKNTKEIEKLFTGTLKNNIKEVKDSAIVIHKIK